MKTWSKFTLGLRTHIGESSHSLFKSLSRTVRMLRQAGGCLLKARLCTWCPEGLPATEFTWKRHVWREWEPALSSVILTQIISWVVQWRKGVELEGVRLGIQAGPWQAASRVTSAFVGLPGGDQRIVMSEVNFFLTFLRLLTGYFLWLV